MDENTNSTANTGSGSKWTWVIIIILIIAALFYYMKRPGSVSPVLNDNGEVSGNYSLKDIISMSKSLQCDFEKAQDQSTVKGSVYIAKGGMVRGDFDIGGSPVGTIQSHFINRDGFSYTWTSMANIGYKKAVTGSASAGASPQDQAQFVGQDDKVDYKCSSWSEDASKFTLPEGISFTTL